MNVKWKHGNSMGWVKLGTYQCTLEPLPSFLFPSCHEGKEWQFFRLPSFSPCLIHRHPPAESHKPVLQPYFVKIYVAVTKKYGE